MDQSRSQSIALGVKDWTGLDFQTLSGKINPTRSPSPEVNEVAADPEETDSNEEEAGNFDEDVGGFDEEEGGGFNKEGEQHFNNEGGVFSTEEVAQDSNLERRGKDTDGIVHVEGEKVGKECEMLGIWTILVLCEILRILGWNMFQSCKKNRQSLTA